MGKRRERKFSGSPADSHIMRMRISVSKEWNSGREPLLSPFSLFTTHRLKVGAAEK
jgi:hypothetical protein